MFKINWNCDARKALGSVELLSSLFGLWPLDKDNSFLRIRWCIAALSLTLQVLLATYETQFNCNYGKSGVDNLLVMTFGLIGLAKMIFYYKHREKLRHNVESAIEDWSSGDMMNFSSVMKRNRNIHNRISLLYMVTGLLALIMYPVKVFWMGHSSTLGFKSVAAHDIGNANAGPSRTFLFSACSLDNVSEYSYFAIVSAQCIQCGVSTGVNIACDTFFIAIALHLAGQYTILTKKLANFEGYDNQIETRKRFGALVERHAQLLKLSKNIEASFNMIILTQMIINVIIINVAGFNFLLYLKRGEVLGALSNLTVAQFTLVQTFMYSYIGDDLNSHGVDTALSVYNVAWYTMPKTCAKNIMFVMAQTNYSFHLTAGKFFKMTRGTFTDIVKTAVSYLSVLRILINERVI